MGKFSEASQNIRRLSAMFKGLMDMSEEMDKVDSLETYTKELEASKNKLLDEKEALLESKKSLEEQCLASKELADKILSEAKAKAAAMAEQNAKDQISVAEDIKAAFEKCDKEIMEQKLAFIAELEVEQLALKDLKAEFASQKAKLDEVNAALDKIKGGI